MSPAVRVRQRTAAIPSALRKGIMKRTIALALATFLGLGLLSTSLSAARDALHGVTSWSGDYGTE